MKELSYEEIKIATDDFSDDRLIGKGSHGTVYKGILKGDVEVAIKKPSDVSKLNNEIKIMSSIDGSSPNMVNLVGICHSPSHKFLVTEYMPNGSLYDLLHSSSSPPSWPHRFLIALQVSCSILSLHDVNPSSIVHRDVKSANVLFDKNWNARLADFGLAIREDDSDVPAAGTMGYLDPGYTASHRLSVKNDVFSFGVLLLEIVSARRAMEMGCDLAWIVSWAVPMIREGRVKDVCDKRVVVGREMEWLINRVLRIARKCLEVKEERRPTMGEVVRGLRRVAECGGSSSRWSLRNMILRRMYGCGRAWRMCKKKKTKRSTIKIACKDHLIYDKISKFDKL